VIEHMKEAEGPRGGREVMLPARPGGDALLRFERRSGDDQGSHAVTGLGLDVVFPVLHGPFGEDGTVQGLLELANVAYVGCGVLASAVGMDKAVMKELFKARGLRITPWVVVRQHHWLAGRDAIIQTITDTLTYPVFVKPANLGSSLGISKVTGPDTLGAAIDLASSFDPKVVVETGVTGARELECAVLGSDAPDASVVGEIVPAGEFYDYRAKYLDTGSRCEIPAAIPPQVAERVRQDALTAFDTIDGTGLARVDFLLASTGDLFVNEINTMPGFTTISMYAKLWAASGVEYPALIDRLVALAIERHARQQQRRISAF
jgi:D-alanine-D-alanine ligase